MKNLVRIFLEGAYSNIKRIFFASDRVTDMELRSKILEGRVVPTDKVAETSCIGCGGCCNACPTSAISMIPLEEPVELMEGLVKKQVPKIDELKCVHCYNCHDFCPIYALFGRQEPYTQMMLERRNQIYPSFLKNLLKYQMIKLHL